MRAVIDDPAERFDSRERAAAKTLLLRPDGIAEWLALRRLRPWPPLVNILVVAMRAALITSAAVCVVVWGLAFFLFGISPNLLLALGTLLSVAVFILVATACAIVAAYAVTPGLSHEEALAFDAVLAGIASAGVGAAMLGTLSSDVAGTGWIAADMDRYGPPSLSWLIFFAFAAPSFAVTRWLLGTSPPRITSLESALPAVGWPVFAVTSMALAAQWGGDDVAKAASFAWASLLIGIVAFSVTVAKVEAEWFVLPDRSGIRYIISKIGKSGTVALALSVVVLGLTSLVFQSVSKKTSTPVLNIPANRDSVRLRVIPDTPVRVSASSRDTLKVGLPQEKLLRGSGLVMLVKNGNQMMKAYTGADYMSLLLGGEFSRAEAGRTHNVVTLTVGDPPSLEICVVDISEFLQKGCGTPDMSPSSWLSVLSRGGKSPLQESASPSGSETLIPIYVYRFPPAPAATIPIPSEKFDAWRSGSQEDYTTVIKPTQDKLVSEFEIRPVRTSLQLSARVLGESKGLDKMLVLERINSEGVATLTKVDDSDSPELSTVIDEPGRYRICVRLFNAVLNDCSGPIYELLPDPVRMSLAPVEPRR